jgi:hypothetical protein
VIVMVLLYCNIIEIREVSVYHTGDKPKQQEEGIEIDSKIGWLTPTWM